MKRYLLLSSVDLEVRLTLIFFESLGAILCFNIKVLNGTCSFWGLGKATELHPFSKWQVLIDRTQKEHVFI